MRFEVEVSSVLPISYEEVFGRLRQSQTLVRVADPMVKYDGVSEFPKYWQVGEWVNLRPRPFGMFPPNDHWVTFTRIDKRAGILETEEWGPAITTWRHKMTVEPLSSGLTRYTDEVVIEASALVGLFAKLLFYPHRHGRWQEILVQGQ